MSLSVIARAAAFAQQTDEVFLVLLTIDHDDLTQPIRVACNTEQVVSRGVAYVAYPFEITLPDDNDERPPTARLSIDNVSREIGETIRAISTPATASFEVVRAADPDLVEVSFPAFILRNVEWDFGVVKGDLEVENLATEPCPVDSFDPANFPGLF